MIGERQWVRIFGIGIAALLMAAPAVAQQAVPSSEQLLAAALHADDLTTAKIAPGGWWDDAPEFNDELETDSPRTMQNLVMGHIFGKPDEAPSEIATSVRLYRNAASAADDFSATAAGDQQDYASVIDGPKAGDQSRYLRQPEDDQHEGGAAIRFQYGRYLVRIDIGGAAAGATADQIAALAGIVIGRLGALDTGKLAAPPLPPLAASLPAPDSAFGPVLGTATIARRTWSWIWSSRNSALSVSPRLAGMLRDSGGAAGQPVMRRYVVAAAPSNIAELTLMPFQDERAATQYLTEIKREDPRRAGIGNDDGDITISPPIPDVAPAYRADLRVGKYVAEVTCSAPFAPTSAACETAVKELADRAKKKLTAP